MNTRDGRAVVRIIDYFGGPYICPEFETNVAGFLSYIVRNARVKETKCVSQGNEYCEFLVIWDVE